MEFDFHRPIYLQIADYIGDQILAGTLAPGARVPSARDLARDVAVTPNTVTRACVLMQDQGIIENRRGIGYFVRPDAQCRTRQVRKQEFVDQSLPAIFKTMHQVGIDSREFQQRYAAFLQQLHSEQPEPDASADPKATR